MICQKCGTEMNTVYQHELQNISEQHLKYITVLGTSSNVIVRDYMYMPQNVMDIITQSKDTYRYETGTIDNMHLENNMVHSGVMLGSKMDHMATVMENISGQLSLGQEEKNKIETKQEEISDKIEVKNEEIII